DRDSELGRQVAGLIDRGEFVPDDVTMRVIAAEVDGRIARRELDPAKELLVLDGVPRTCNQASLIGGIADVLGVVYLVCNDVEAMVARIKARAAEGREDDADESIVRHRFEIYRNETAPVLDCFDGSQVHEIDAMGTPATVLGAVLRAVAPLQANLDA
ncbi:MAG: nucleoside monophosphate kinase, partial [Planctomycetota bacterium]